MIVKSEEELVDLKRDEEHRARWRVLEREVEMCGERLGACGRDWEHAGEIGSMRERLGACGRDWEHAGEIGSMRERLGACGRGWKHVGCGKS